MAAFPFTTCLRFVALATALFAVTACGFGVMERATMPLAYTPQSAATPGGRAVVGMGEVRVTRDIGSEDAAWIGSIRGSFGQPIKKLYSETPVDQAVGRALSEGLRVRGLLAPEGLPPQRRLVVDVAQLAANQYARSEAMVALRLTLVDGPSGRQVWSDTVQANRIEGSTMGGFANFHRLEDLHSLLVRVLGEAVDQALDNPGFRAAL
ncbi:SHOCT domain-containing protein [Roseomonas hellenica]|uniref:SHOCT domain-containing protein n=1 Tax=Plastoroseomonas hellenica TaxID=2687306 RepID=A0ABS5EUK8_9PROT|nr:hypothetical protein [Plastoroseomonas hellenica]MBR0663991.1 SHOCT domain-containing protein [Plastoroseomonas hellenica]